MKSRLSGAVSSPLMNNSLIHSDDLFNIKCQENNGVLKLKLKVIKSHLFTQPESECHKNNPASNKNLLKDFADMNTNLLIMKFTPQRRLLH